MRQFGKLIFCEIIQILTPPATLLIRSPAAAEKSGPVLQRDKLRPLASPAKRDNGVGTFPRFLSQEKGKTEKFSFP
ncbi:MAG: hypothetical protein CVV37_06790 [Nitrospira bacterium HGW-Nitrospira-1]|nr:MAG: hypothetical protein CVV37_06790 [Nitrospira bacterium HGW-Nitrospira-1]